MYNKQCKATSCFASLKHKAKFCTLQVRIVLFLIFLLTWWTHFISHMRLAQSWTFTLLNFDSMQGTGPNIECGCTFHMWVSFCIKVLIDHSYKSKAFIELLLDLFMNSLAMKWGLILPMQYFHTNSCSHSSFPFLSLIAMPWRVATINTSTYDRA